MVARLELAAPAVAFPPGFRVFSGGRELIVRNCSVRDGSSLLIGFEGVDSVDSAGQLRGEVLSARRSDLLGIPGMLPLGLFEGLRVVWRQGFGRVTGADSDAANTLLRIDSGGKVFPIPMAMVLAEGTIDWDEGVLELDLPDGLTDLEGGF